MDTCDPIFQNDDHSFPILQFSWLPIFVSHKLHLKKLVLRLSYNFTYLQSDRISNGLSCSSKKITLITIKLIGAAVFH